MSKLVQTVTGPVRAEELGVTLTHEHAYFDCKYLYERAHPHLNFSDEKITPENRTRVMKDLDTVLYKYGDNLCFDDTDLIVKELAEYKAAGGQSLVEVTTIDLGRDPLKLRRISEKTGLQIVMGGSYYHYPSLPEQTKDFIVNLGVNGLADFFIKELQEGVGGTGIRPGVIGEVGPGDDEGSDIIMHAAAIAQRETGVPAIVHYATMDTLRIFEEERADISKLVMGHWGIEFPVDEAVRRGAMISFDQFGMNFPGIKGDDERLREVMSMLEKGYLRRLLLSQDVCWKIRLRKCGGQGYAYILQDILPQLKEMGVTDEQMNTLLIDNVRELFA